jgi:ABC-type nitrate/sulfonate/bicarbonate transport system substrate-binding protein
MLRLIASLLGIVALALPLISCSGGGGGDVADERVRLLLDFTPNGVHAGIYVAQARGFDTAEGVTMRIRKPGASTDALKLLRTGAADVAVLDIHDLGLARERGADVVAFAALVQRPLAAVLAQPGIRSPKDLEGRKAGVAGLPSDTAVLRSVVRGGGGDPRKVDEVTIGFEAVRAMLAKRVSAATAFWNVEGVALRERRPRVREFRVDDFGAPAYPELVLVTTRSELEEEQDALIALVRALQRGYGEAQIDPESAAGAMLERERGLDRAGLLRQIEAVAPAWTAGTRVFGRLRRDVLEQWADWDVEFGILQRRPDLDRAFAFDLGS